MNNKNNISDYNILSNLASTHRRFSTNEPFTHVLLYAPFGSYNFQSDDLEMFMRYYSSIIYNSPETKLYYAEQIYEISPIRYDVDISTNNMDISTNHLYK